ARYPSRSMIKPTFEEFSELSRQGNIIPLSKAVTADLLTPVLAYLKIEAGMSHAFLLESVEGGEKIARYSFIGCNPYLIIKAKVEVVEIIRGGESKKRKGRLIDVMRKVTERHRPVAMTGLPPFTGGAVGYFGYDAVRWIENIPQKSADDLQLDDAVMMFFSNVLAFDHVRQQILIISNALLDEGASNLEAKYQKAVDEIGSLEAMLRRPARTPEFGAATSDTITIRSNFSRADYLKAVERGKEYIKAGDIFQVVLSQRFSAA